MAKKTIACVTVEDVEKRRCPTKHYVFVLKVMRLDGISYTIYRRYSQFFILQSWLLDNFPTEAGINRPKDRIIPFLPGKIIFGRSNVRKVAMQRLLPIQTYCKQLLDLPSKISESVTVLDFFTANEDDIQAFVLNKRESQPADGEIEEISDPLLCEAYWALADYKKNGKHEINLTAGEKVEIIEKNEMGWWFVSAADGQGWIPAAYLTKNDENDEDMAVDEEIPQGQTYICCKSYEAQNSDELSVIRGMIVIIRKKALDGWWLAEYDEQKGLVPGCYLAALNSRPSPNTSNDRKFSIDLAGSSPKAGKNRLRTQSFDQASKEKPFVKYRLSPLPGKKFAPWSPQVTGDQRFAQGLIPEGTIKQKQATEEQQKKRPDSKIELPKEIKESQFITKPPPNRKGSVKKTALKFANGDSTNATSQYSVMKDFDGATEGAVHFSKGEHVKLVQKCSNDWWIVQKEGKLGRIASKYISQNPDKQEVLSTVQESAAETEETDLTKKLPSIQITSD